MNFNRTPTVQELEGLSSCLHSVLPDFYFKESLSSDVLKCSRMWYLVEVSKLNIMIMTRKYRKKGQECKWLP